MTVTLYTRRGCHLCDAAKGVIEAARARVAFDYQELDIDADAELLRLYNEEVPVIAIDGKKTFWYQVALEDLLKKLKERA